MSTSLSFAALPDFALIEVTGPDSERFLQGQLTCDVVALEDSHWTLGACCTAKGRMIANFVIARIDNAFWLRLPKAQVMPLKEHLHKYAVFFKATLTEHLDDWQVTGSVQASTEPQLLEAPRPVDATDYAVCFHWPDGRTEQWLRSAQALPDHTTWPQADIKQGLVWVTPASVEQWVPQNIDWHQQGGVSFSKGCYTGQEIVARLQYLGKSKKRLVHIHSNRILDADVLEKIQNAKGSAIGEVVAWHEQQGLAYINQNEHSELTLNNQPLSISQLFYADDNVQ